MSSSSSTSVKMSLKKYLETLVGSSSEFSMTDAGVGEGRFTPGLVAVVTGPAAIRFLSGRTVLTAGFWRPGLAPR